jgi:tRNA A37 N6-isopentenylltransferase MiaA
MNERTRQLAKRQRTWFRHQMAASPLASGRTTAQALAERIADAFPRG